MSEWLYWWIIMFQLELLQQVVFFQFSAINI
jgi:hypothetical protein